MINLTLGEKRELLSGFDEVQMDAALNPNRAAAAALVVHDEMTLRQAAIKVGISVSTVRRAVDEALDFSRLQ